jgi:SAM-dependent methyltransferase
VPPGARWLDVGCGTGELSRAVQEAASPAAVTGVDRSADYVRYAGEHSSGIEYRVGDATELPAEDASFDVAVSGLVLNFVPDTEGAVREMARATRPGGLVAAYVWDYADGMQFMRYFWDAAADVDSAAKELDEGARFPVCRPGGLSALFSAAGLANVEADGIVVPTTFANFDDYWRPFLGGQGPGPTLVAALSEDQRDRLRETLRERLPVAADGSIAITARAWAAKGHVPAP